MALKFYWRAENNTTLDGTHDYSAGDTTATSNSASFSASAAYKGSYGIVVPASTDSSYQFTATSIINNPSNPANSVGSAAFMIKFPIAIHTVQGIYFGLRVLDVSSTADSIQTISGFNSSGAMKFGLKIGNSNPVSLAMWTGEYCITADNWFGVVVRWDIPNDKRAIEVYNSSGTLVGSAEDTSTNLGSVAPLNLTSFRWGRSAGHANDVYMDNVFVADTYDEPLQNYVCSISSYTEYGLSGSPLILPHRSGGGMIDLSGNFRG